MQIGTRKELLEAYHHIPVDVVPYRNTHRYQFTDGLNQGDSPVYHPGERVPSVTTVLGIVDKSGALLPWAERRALDYFAGRLKAELQGGGRPFSEWDAAKREEQLKLLVAEVKDALAEESASKLDFGTAVHNYLNDLFRSAYVADGGTPEDYLYKVNTPDNPEVGYAALAAIQWLEQQGAVKVWPEEVLFHPAGQLPPGQADMIFQRAGRDAPLEVVDWKAASGVYDSHCWQVAAYAINLARLTGRGFNGVKGWVVKLPTPDKDEFQAEEVKGLALGASLVQAAAQLYEAKSNASFKRMTGR